VGFEQTRAQILLVQTAYYFIPINKSVATLLLIENQTQYGFLNKEMATPFLYLVLVQILDEVHVGTKTGLTLKQVQKLQKLITQTPKPTKSTGSKR